MTREHEPLPTASLQRSARNLLAWADRIMQGGYGETGSVGYANALYSWRQSYEAFRREVPPMEPPVTSD